MGLLACFLVDGEAQHQIGERTFTQEPGSLFVRHTVEKHLLKAKGNLFLMEVDPEKTMLSLECAELVSAHREIFPPMSLSYAKAWVDLAQVEDPTFLKAVLHRFLKEKLRVQPPDFLAYAQRDIVAEICRSVLLKGITTLGKEGLPKLVSDLLDIIESEFASGLSLENLAQQLKVSEGHLSRTFKEHTGWKVIDHLIERRLQAVKEDLLWTRSPIQDVARKAGFREMPHFNRIFRNRVGCTPKHYRDRSSEMRS